jgi:rhomboid protease GluP
MFSITLTKTNSPMTHATVDESVLIRFGAVSPKKIKTDHQYWRLFTGMFLHVNISHLLLDVIIEVIFVLSREASWRFLRFFAVFLLSNLAGAFMTLVFAGSPRMAPVGANNGLFGVFGAFVSLYIIVFERLLWKHRISMLLLMLVNGLLLTFATSEQVNKTGAPGQVGGLFFGFCIGWSLFSVRSRCRRVRILGTLIGIVMCVGIIAIPATIFFVWTKV